MRFRLYLFTLLLLSGCLNDPALDKIPESFGALPEEQQFLIDPTRDTVLFTEAGVRLFFPAQTFVRRNGQPAEELVSISFIEAVSMADRMEMGAAASTHSGSFS